MSAFSRWLSGIDTQDLIVTLLFAVAAMISIPVHESCHGLASLALGDDTAKRMGRISLNPLRHVDPIGLVMMVVLRFGWARGVPIDMRRFKNPKLGMALTAAAGPLSNLVLALISALLYLTFLYAGGWKGEGGLYYLALFFNVMLLLNAGLAIFNLIPISPLDGSKILAIVLPQEAYAALMRYERYGFLVLIALTYAGVLSGPLVTARTWVVEGMLDLVRPLALWIAGV